MARTRRNIVQDLMRLGWSKTVAGQAYSQWGSSALDVLRQDPYSALFLNSSIKWMELDRLALQLGIAESSPERISGGIRYALLSSMNDGHVFLPLGELQQKTARLIRMIQEDQWEDAMHSMLHNRELMMRKASSAEDSSVYLRDLYLAETQIARRFAEMHASASSMALQAPAQEELDHVERDLRIDLAPAQRDAIVASLTHKLVVITGGPGTGKTTIVRGVLRLWKQRGARIKLAAPTGRAAKRLSESTGRQAFTLHRLLEYDPEISMFKRNSKRPLRVDLMVVDESSMIDTALMASLLEALPSSCHLLLVGDVDQLPAVGPGFVLHDLIESECLCTIRLSQIFRQDEGSLISINAQKINQGEMPEMNSGGVDEGQDFFFINRPTPLGVREAIVEMVTQRIPLQFGFDPKEDVQVLCPMIKKDVGVEAMNAILQESLNSAESRYKAPFYSLSPGDKIMQTKNDYSKDVFNGDIGYVWEIDAKNNTATINFEGKSVVYERHELDNTTLAYAVTVHKSQGSEYPAVVAPLVMQHFPMLQRNLLYTAVSRGKKLVVLVGEQRALQMAVRNNRIRARHTGLQSLLKEAFAKVESKK
ncbi:MAG: ATP-dependent RecD-like DNA helicase [Candidatus Omnitrophica bacterium]|nr:ATP-dependent RecD-like DNA helicase [Candidatus Omnitrophota bacterium]